MLPIHGDTSFIELMLDFRDKIDKRRDNMKADPTFFLIFYSALEVTENFC